jgi:hypothetical protein
MSLTPAGATACMVTVVLTSSSPVTGKMSKQQNEAERHKPILQHCCKKTFYKQNALKWFN